MATFNWFGGYGRYSGARHWDPRGVPGQGDTAVVAGGEVVLRWQDVQATVLLGGTDAGSQPVLDLHSSSLGTLTMPDNLQKPVDVTVPIPPEYGEIDVWGQSSIAAINLGDYESQVRAPPPYGHPSIGAPETLTVNLHGRAALSTGFDVKFGSALTVNGGARSSFNATDSTIEAGRVVINAPLSGQSTIAMIAGPTTYTFDADPGSLELGGGVGDGTTIDIRIGNLQIDKPLEFQGQVYFDPTQNTAGQSPYILGPQSALLQGLSATSFRFDDDSHTMTLLNGDTAVDQIRLPGIVSAMLEPPGPGATAAAAIRVAQTADGVVLRGGYSYGTADTLIPLQTYTSGHLL